MCKKNLIIFVFALSLFSSGLSGIDVMMNSAETIDPGNFKVAVFPVLVFGKGGADSRWGVAGRAGLGLTRSVDVEVKAALLKNITYFGIDVEYWFLKGRKFNVSAIGGWHMTDSELGADSSGVEAALIASTRPSERLELVGGLRFMFDSLKNTDYNYTLAHIIPGFEYKISKTIDFLGEFGIALNDNSNNYISFGFAHYFLR